MNDFDYEVRQKAILARNARYKKNGSRTRYVSLPSDHLTSAAKKKMNGSVTVYKIGEKISWTEFRQYPKEMQIEYLNSFKEKFNASPKMMITLFGCAPSAFYSYTKDHPHLKGILMKGSSQEDKARFYTWLQEQGGSEPVVEPPEPKKPAKVAVVEKKPEMPYFANTLLRGNLTLEGSGTEIASTLFGILRDKRFMVELTFSEVPELPVEEEPEEPIEEVEEPEEPEEPKNDGLINLNTASFQQLRWVGFSNNITLNILNLRPLHTKEDLLAVPGMNEKIYKNVEHKICMR